MKRSVRSDRHFVGEKAAGRANLPGEPLPVMACGSRRPSRFASEIGKRPRRCPIRLGGDDSPYLAEEPPAHGGPSTVTTHPILQDNR